MFISEGNNYLRGAHIILRPLTLCDEAAYVSQFSASVRNSLHVNSIEQEQLYFHERVQKQEAGKTFFYGIYLATTNQLIGAIEIRDPQEHRGQLYCWVHESFRGKGYIQEAIVLAAHGYFKKTNQTFITAFVDVSNPRSYWALKRAGFADLAKLEGANGKQYELILRNKMIRVVA